MKTRTYLTLAFTVGFLMVLVCVGIVWNNMEKRRSVITNLSRENKVMYYFQRLSTHLKSAEIYSPEFIEDSSALAGFYKKDVDCLAADIHNLNLLYNNKNTEQLRRIDTLNEKISSIYNWFVINNISQVIRNGQYQQEQKTLLEVHMLIQGGIEHGIEIIKVLEAKRDSLVRQTFITLLVLIGAAISFWIFVTLILQGQISQRFKTEMFLQSVLNASLNGITSWQAVRENDKIVDLKLVYYNQQAETQLGRQLEGRTGSMYRQIYENNGEAEGLIFDRAVQALEERRGDEFEIQFRDEISGWYRVKIHSMENGGGCTIAFIDITDLKQAVEKAEMRQNELMSFSYVASHDLNEPLRKIRTFAGMIRRLENLSAQASGLFERIEKAVVQMQVLIDDLLAYSQTGSDNQTFEETDLNQLVQEVLNEFRFRIEEINAEIQVDDLPTVNIIDFQMRQLFANLIGNSLKFCKSGRACRIQIQAQEVRGDDYLHLGAKPGQRYWRFTETDNGIGFEQKYAEKIFEVFQRLHGRSEFPGTGIGLAICKKVAENHGGFIIAQGRPDEGATFEVFIPLND